MKHSKNFGIFGRIAFWTVLAAAALWLGAQLARAQNPPNTPQLNSDFYVASVKGWFPSIQSAITQTCAKGVGARVVIAAGSAPTDSIAAVLAGCTQVSILDRRSLPEQPYAWNGVTYALVPYPGTGGGGGGGTPAAPSFAVQLANAGATSFAADPNITINPTTHTFQTPSIAANNTLFGVSMPAHIDTAADYVQRATNGNVTNQPFPLELPWQMTQTTNRRFGPSQGETPLFVKLFLLSGTDNTDTLLGNFGIATLESFSLAPQQGGGAFAVEPTCYGVGDCVGETMTVLGRGTSRGEDEGNENPRDFAAVINDVAGGTITAVSTDAQGANPIKTAIIQNIYSQNFYEKAIVMDLSKKFQSPGNIASIGTAADNRFEFFQGDATSGITGQVGISTQTLLTAPIDNFVYTGACGAQTKTAAQYPISGPSTGANDGFMTNYQGIGAPGENTNYGATGTSLVGFCATVASTAGMSPGTLIFIADKDYAIEYTRVIAVADGTHFTAFMRSAHSTGATVNFGGGVGSCIGADVDIAPIGANSTADNDQFAPQHLCYPIVQSLAGDQVTVYTNPEGSDENNLNTLLPAANTPKVPLVISNPVVTGGVLTGLTSNSAIGNANDYTANNTGIANSGHPRFLPVPTVTVGGCTVAPVLKFTAVVANVGLTYAPSIVSGGSGCGTVTFNVAPFLPTPFGIFPMAMVYKSEDPTLPPGVTAPANNKLTNGNPVLMPFNTASMAIGDTISEGEWWNGRSVSGQYNYNGRFYAPLDGRHGPMLVNRFTGVSQAYYLYQNSEPTLHYYGTFANNYVPFSTSEEIVLPPALAQIDGQYSNIFNVGFPPLSPTGGILSGGSLLNVTCARNQEAINVDPPCEHGIDFPYNIFNAAIGIGSNLSIFANHTAGIIGVGAGTKTFQAPTLTAYQTGISAPDVALLGLTFSGPQAGPCMRFDLLLTTTGHPLGQSYSRVCGFLDQSGSTLGDLSFQTVNAGGSGTYATPLLLNANTAKFSVPIASTVATGTAPLSIASTTQVPNLNASQVGGVALSGLCQTSGAGCAAGLTTTFSITTTIGSCSFTYTQGKLTAKTGSC